MFEKLLSSIVGIFILVSLTTPVVAVAGAEQNRQLMPSPKPREYKQENTKSLENYQGSRQNILPITQQFQMPPKEQQQIEKEFEVEVNGMKYKKKVIVVHENGVMKKIVEIEMPKGKREYKHLRTIDSFSPEQQLNPEDFDDGAVVGEGKRCAQFQDVQTEEKLCKYLNAAKNKAVVSPNQRFFANAPVSRAQFAGMIVRAFDLRIEIDKTQPFEDVDQTNTFFGAVMVLKELGIVSGATLEDGVSRFFPNKPITRGEAIKILVNTLDESGKFKFETEVLPTLVSKFKDEGIDNDRFAEYIKKLYSSEGKMPELLVKGYSDGFLRTGRLVSRIEAITMITRAMWAAGLVDKIGEVDPGAGTGSMINDEDDDSDDDNT